MSTADVVTHKRIKAPAGGTAGFIQRRAGETTWEAWTRISANGYRRIVGAFPNETLAETAVLGARRPTAKRRAAGTTGGRKKG